MAKKKSEPRKRMMSKRPPGVMCGVEFYKTGRVRLDDPEKNAIRALLQKKQQQDQAARREQIILIWKKHLYDRGLQHILPARIGWTLPAIGSGYHPQDTYSRSMFVCNIYNPFGQMISSVLTRQIPPGRFAPMDPEDDVDITTSEGAEKLEKRIDSDNQLKSKMESMARFLYLDGLTVFLQTYQLDGQRFGYESEDLKELEDETVPEDEEDIADEERASGEGMPDGMGSDEGEDLAGSEEDQGDHDKDHSRESSSEDIGDEDELGSEEPQELPGKARGHEVIEVGGALEWKLPIKAECRADCTYAIRAKEIPLQLARAKYPWVADQMQPAQGGPGGDDIDRLARVNTKLGVLDNFNTTDTQIQDVTEMKAFLRPCELLDDAIPEDLREGLVDKFPMGMYATFCGEVFCEAYNASMDDHIVTIFGLPGDGAHRPGLGDWLVPIQEVLNNWLELANDYFIRGVPAKWMDNEVFDVKALRQQTNLPGETHPFDREPGVTLAELIFEESPLAFPPELQSFINDFKGATAQLITGAVPALTGEGDASATDTFGGMLVQRDQALGRQGLPWRQIKEGLCEVKRQAIQVLARNHEGAVTITGSESVTVELEDMKGNFHVFCDDDENIPASFTQKQNSLAKVFELTLNNQAIGELLLNPDNLEVFRDYGMEDLTFPQIASRDKQLGEWVILARSGPLPNPQISALKKQIVALQEQAKVIAAGGAGMTPEQQQQIATQIAALQQQQQALPPLVSTVPIRWADDDATELYVVKKILNSSRGRELANGDEEDQAAYMNLELHGKEHEAALKQKTAANQQPTRPPSTSINIKDLPSKEAAALATQAGLPATPADFDQQAVADAAEKHPGSGGVTIQ